ncbi:MAG: prepilin peptidase [Alcaligenaceae bacterium]|nr:prepilin peptidase [Alcaligenaceae bacterium]
MIMFSGAIIGLLFVPYWFECKRWVAISGVPFVSNQSEKITFSFLIPVAGFSLWTSLGNLSVVENLIIITAFSTLVAVSIIDAITGYLPNTFTYTMCIAGCVVNVIGLGIFSLGLQAVYACAAGYAILWLANKCYFIITGKEGVGMGDAKLLAAILAWVGASSILPVLLIANTSAIVWYFFIAKKNASTDASEHSNGHTLPFGPHLGLGAAIIFCQIANPIF